MLAIDANVLVRLVTRDDPKQLEAAEAFEPQSIARALEMLLDHAHLTMQDPETITAALTHFRKRPSLGFSDCLVFEAARKAGHLPLGTFDRTLATLDGTQKLGPKK